MLFRDNRRLFVAVLSLGLAASCGDSGGGPPSEDTSGDAIADTVSDAGDVSSDSVDSTDDTAPDVQDTTADADADAVDSDGGDTGTDTDSDADAGDGDVSETCGDGGVHECPEVGVTECSDEATVRECILEDECRVWSATGCGEEVCFEGACVDVCETRDECPAAAWCDEDAAVACAADDDGCLVESSREDCTFGCTDGACDPNPCSAAPCVVGTDEPYCDGDAFVSCAFDAEAGCHHWTAEDCSETERYTCLDNGFDVGCDENPCGDGFADGFVGEECDDGNGEDGDGCSSACEIEEGGICISTGDGLSVCQLPACGDSEVEFGEACDDGAGAGCTDACVVAEGYSCEGSPSVCTTLVCGDGDIGRGEGCDDGGTSGADGCSASCASELSPIPGSTLEFEGTLDFGDPLLSRPQVTCAATTGGSYLYDHVRIANPTDTAIEVDVEAVFTGEGALFAFEPDFDEAAPATTCVSGSNTHPRYGRRGAKLAPLVLAPGAERVLLVTTSSQRVPIGDYTVTVLTRGCGDAQIVDPESCDDGNLDDGDGCEADCTVTDGWACVDAPSYCHVPGCGGGLVEDGEECDDGNTTPDDGCTSCTIDEGAECSGGRPSVCRFPACGDGLLDAGEACDDGNADDGDGCTSCAVDAGWVCAAEPSVCTEIVCGNGVVSAPYESCDDGNTTGGDGCSATCLVELAAAGSSVEISGASETTDPIFVRASESCGSSSALVYFDEYTVTNPAGSAVRLTVTAAWTGAGFLHVYSAFDGSAPTAGCIDGSAASGGASTVEAVVGAGDTVTIVVSAVSSFTAHGAYTLTLASAVP